MTNLYRRALGLATLMVGLSATWVLYIIGGLNVDLVVNPIFVPAVIMTVIWYALSLIALGVMIFDKKLPVDILALFVWGVLFILKLIMPKAYPQSASDDIWQIRLFIMFLYPVINLIDWEKWCKR